MKFMIGVTNEKGDNAKFQTIPGKPNYVALVENEEEAQAWLDANNIETPYGWELFVPNPYMNDDGRMDYGRVAADAMAREKARKAEALKVRCPKCSSESLHAGKRGWSPITGFFGSGTVLIKCLKCGDDLKPGQG